MGGGWVLFSQQLVQIRYPLDAVTRTPAGGGGMNYNDRNLIPAWAQEQGGCFVGVLLTLAMIGVAVMYFMGWL